MTIQHFIEVSHMDFVDRLARDIKANRKRQLKALQTTTKRKRIKRLQKQIKSYKAQIKVLEPLKWLTNEDVIKTSRILLATCKKRYAPIIPQLKSILALQKAFIKNIDK